MHRELNTGEEMLRRLAYLIYVLCLFFGFLFAIRGIALGSVEQLLTALGFGLGAYVLRWTGQRYLEFRRLAKSFPLGSKEDHISKERRLEIEKLLMAFHQSSDWVERQDIRQKLEAIVQSEPVLFHAYGPELALVHPTFFQISAEQKR